MISLGAIARALDVSHRNKARREAAAMTEDQKRAEARRRRDEKMEAERLAFLTQQLIRRSR